MSEVAEKGWNFQECKPGKRKALWNVQFMAVPIGGKATFALLGDVVWAPLHWADGRHHLCLAPYSHCPYDALGIPFRPHGFVAVEVQSGEGKARPQIVHITETMALDCPSILEEGIRGFCFTLTGPRKKRGRSKLTPASMVSELQRAALGTCPDVREIVRRAML